MPIFLISFIVFFSSLSFALPVEELTGKFLADGGDIEYQTKEFGVAHQILLSTPKRINNELSVEKDKRVKGEMSTSLLRLSSMTPLSEAFNFIARYIEDNGTTEYKCQHRGCGVSSYWANDFFNEKRLSGRDSDQYYIAGSIKHVGAEYWLTAYLVSNALRQNLIYINYIKKPLENVGWTNGYQLPLNHELPEEIKLTLISRLEADPELGLFVAAYVDGKKIKTITKMEKVVTESLQGIQKNLSTTLAIDPNRIHLRSVGAFHTQTQVDESKVWFRLFLYPL
jgi:hypothetical protein|tara:strand:- start:707 stop:1552 length:846 start_codon:yes stop_codon:yes gene_type:complete